MALLDDLFVGHQCLGPVNGAEADATERDRHGQAERDVVEAYLADADELSACIEGYEKVGDDESDRAKGRQEEHRYDLEFGTLGGLLVNVATARNVRGKARILETVGQWCATTGFG